MLFLTRVAQSRVALITAVSLLVSQNAGVVFAQNPATPATTAKPTAAKPASASAATPTQAAKPAAAAASPAVPRPIDGGWPRSYTTSSGAALVLYQPQVATWDQQKLMTAYAAASYTPAGAPKPALGTFQIEADTNVSVAERLVDFSKYRINEANFPTLPKEQLRIVIADVAASVPAQERVLALDRVFVVIDKS